MAHPEISEEMYRRLYRLMKRNLDPMLISATLNVPIHTVNSIIARLGSLKDTPLSESSESQTGKLAQEDFLDIYFYGKTRYAILHMVGVITEQTSPILKIEFDKIIASSWKAIALRISDVTSIDETGSTMFKEFHTYMNSKNRYTAFLDPSPEIDKQLSELGIDSIVPIFGTESAFDEKAFISQSASTWKSKK